MKMKTAIKAAMVSCCLMAGGCWDGVPGAEAAKGANVSAAEVKAKPTEQGNGNQTATLGDALKAANELGQKMNELNKLKKDTEKAWSDVKSEFKKGMDSVMSGKDKEDLKKSMEGLKSAAEALKMLSE